MVEDVTKDYVKEAKNSSEEVVKFDLNNKDDVKAVEEELSKMSVFFKPENDVVYRINLTSSEMMPVTKEFKKKNDEVQIRTQYSINIHAIDKDKREFNGIWEIGIKTFKKVFAVLKEQPDKDVTKISFRLRKAGQGIETDYDIMSEEF